MEGPRFESYLGVATGVLLYALSDELVMRVGEVKEIVHGSIPPSFFTLDRLATM